MKPDRGKGKVLLFMKKYEGKARQAVWRAGEKKTHNVNLLIMSSTAATLYLLYYITGNVNERGQTVIKDL